MRKIILTGALLLTTVLGKAQFTQNDVIYYVGAGPDTAIIVIDFLDGTEDSSYAWGFVFDASDLVTGGDALAALDLDEAQLSISTGGGFLNDITYNAHSGLGGDPNYWGTWSRTELTDWEMNAGLPEILEDGEWFGCSYTDFEPAIVPGEPLPAYKSDFYTFDQVSFWVGEGANSAIFVVDFVTDAAGEAVSYAWGYRFDGTTDGAEMLAAIDAADVNLSINADGFLNDIIFNDLEGLAGDPNYWATWSGTNLSNWTMNEGLSTEINDGDWYGCSYAEWPPRRPFYPISAIDSAAFYPVLSFFGAGPNTVYLVLDFNEWAPGSSYAFGYNFEGTSITAEEVMTELALVDELGLSFNLSGGYLNDVAFDVMSELGIGGAPYYWSTWSATNVGGWELNEGISHEMVDGEWFAGSYTSWSPATPPSLPEGYVLFNVDGNELPKLSIYPNPANDFVSIELDKSSDILVVDLQGKQVLRQVGQIGVNTLDLSTVSNGTYFIELEKEGVKVRQKLVVSQ
jgi:hypothetical protein